MNILEKGKPFDDSGHKRDWDKFPEGRTQCECGCTTFEVTQWSYETLGKCTKCGHVYSLHSG